MRDRARQPCADRAIGVRDREPEIDEARLVDRRHARLRGAPIPGGLPGAAPAAPTCRAWPSPARCSSGVRSSESAPGSPVRRCRRRSTRPTASSSDRRPSEASSSRTSWATKRRYASTISGVPPYFARSSGRWLAMPTGHVSRWHERTMRHPSAISSAVPNETSSAPSSAATTHVAAGLDPPVDPHPHASAQAVCDERLLGLRKAELPRRACVLDRGQRARARAAVRAADVNDVGVGLARHRPPRRPPPPRRRA